jgi:hypothetical protein
MTDEGKEAKARKRFFFEKKNQKTSIRWSSGDGRCHNACEAPGKSFLVLFFKKEHPSFTL